ncbi:hypothetical protein E20_19 [Escherichia phage E20]|nr:hypothetical protein E20_19 [Escherichia phage E20]WBF79746.1 hypothetical protein F22_0019 [Escherichia phage vB_Eco_F22]
MINKRAVEDFYAHRELVLKRINEAMKREAEAKAKHNRK